MRKLFYLLVTTGLISSCNNNGVSEKRVVEIVDSILISKNLTQSNQKNPIDNSNIDSFIGEWTDGENIDITIGKDKSFIISNPVCGTDFTYKVSGSELILEFQKVECKFQTQDGNNKGKEVGKCYIQNGRLIVEKKFIPELEGTGINEGTFKRGSRFD